MSRSGTPEPETRYIVYDVESVVDGALLERVLYPGAGLGAGAAIRRYQEEKCRDGQEPADVFVPVTFHVPVSIAIARVSADFQIIHAQCLDAPRYDPQAMVDQFWRGLAHYRRAHLVDFNGRQFDIPLLSLCAFRFGVSCPRYFDDDRFGFRYRFTEKHIDLMEWMTEFGAFRMVGGLNLLAKMLGKPGKMDTKGSDVAELFADGKLREINDYCLNDVLDTFFVFLRTRVLMGKISIDDEQEIVEQTRDWIEDQVEEFPSLRGYLEQFGRWNPEPFAEEAAS